jgi:hypothetical protein
MTDQHHPDQNSPDDPIEAALGDAGRRMRSQAPDEVASRQALARVNERAHAPAPRQRPWWPALVGAGLAAAAIVGVIAIRSDDRETLTPATEPTSTSTPASISSIEPSATLAPATTGIGPGGASLVVDGGCITVTTPAGSATGCPSQSTELDHLERRTFVADLDGPVVVTSASSDPLAGLTVTVEAGVFQAPCRWDDLAPRIPDGGLVEVVVCNDTGVMGMTTGRYPDERPGISYFTLPTPYLPEGADLGFGTPVPGLPHAVAFTTSVQDIVTCSLLLLPDRSGWKETCGEIHGLDLATALVQLDSADPTLHEITVDGTGLITSARALDAMAPSSGCSIESANDLARGVFTSSIVMGIGCIGDKASLTTGAILTQDGPPDGSIWLALRENGAWSITDSGTGIDNSFSFPIAPFDTWSTWPESTVPGFQVVLVGADHRDPQPADRRRLRRRTAPYARRARLRSRVPLERTARRRAARRSGVDRRSGRPRRRRLRLRRGDLRVARTSIRRQRADRLAGECRVGGCRVCPRDRFLRQRTVHLSTSGGDASHETTGEPINPR